MVRQHCTRRNGSRGQNAMSTSHARGIIGGRTVLPREIYARPHGRVPGARTCPTRTVAKNSRAEPRGSQAPNAKTISGKRFCLLAASAEHLLDNELQEPSIERGSSPRGHVNFDLGPRVKLQRLRPLHAATLWGERTAGPVALRATCRVGRRILTPASGVRCQEW